MTTPRSAGAGAAARSDAAVTAAWAIVAVAVAVVRNRVWATPNLAFFTAIADHLGSNPFAGGTLSGDYLLTNLLGPTVARVTGQASPHEYARLHLLVLVLGLAAVVAATQRRFGPRAARATCALLAIAPVTTVAMEWLGQPDAFTLPLALGVVVARRTPVRAALGLLLGLAHAEQGAIAALAAGAVAMAIRDLDGDAGPGLDRPTALAALRATAAPLAGVVVGRLAVEVYLRTNDITVTTPRTSFLQLGTLFENHAKSPWLPYALLGPLWVLVLVVAWLRGGHDARRWVALGAVLAFGLVPMILTFDETRVFGVVTAPVLVGAAVLVPRLPWPSAVAGPRAVTALVALALVVPGLFTAGGAYSSWSLPPGEFARFLVDGDHPGDLTIWLLEPFGFEVPDT